MELTSEHFRAIISHNFDVDYQDKSSSMNLIFYEAPSYGTVKNWYNKFNRGRRSLQDEFREGRPKSVVVPENIDAVREPIKQGHHVTYREIEASLGIDITSINTTLHDHLAVKKIYSRWIPHNLTNAMQCQ